MLCYNKGGERIIKVIDSSTSSQRSHLIKLHHLNLKDLTTQPPSTSSAPAEDEDSVRVDKQDSATPTENSGIAEDVEKTMSKKSQSSVWNYFERSEDKSKASCKLCEKEGNQKLLRTDGGTTSGLHGHLKGVHRLSVTGEVLSEVPSRRDPCWDYFQTNPDDSTQLQCKLCYENGTQKIIKLRRDKSKWNLTLHLKAVHKIHTTEAESDKGETSSATETSLQRVPAEATGSQHGSVPQIVSCKYLFSLHGRNCYTEFYSFFL